MLARTHIAGVRRVDQGCRELTFVGCRLSSLDLKSLSYLNDHSLSVSGLPVSNVDASSYSTRINIPSYNEVWVCIDLINVLLMGSGMGGGRSSAQTTPKPIK